MSVRAKFKVARIERSMGSKYKGRNERGVEMYERCEVQTVVLNAVYKAEDNAENTAFWHATPSGEIKLNTINKEAGDYFELEGEYYIDFTKAE